MVGCTLTQLLASKSHQPSKNKQNTRNKEHKAFFERGGDFIFFAQKTLPSLFHAHVLWHCCSLIRANYSPVELNKKSKVNHLVLYHDDDDDDERGKRTEIIKYIKRIKKKKTQNSNMVQLADVPLGQPRIRWSELENDSPSYYKALAAPSNNELVMMWWILSIVNFIDSIIVAVVLLSVITNRRTRKSTFNLYLIYLMIPDFLYSFLCFITCLMCALKGEYWSPAMCRGQAIYLVASTAANAWMNAATTREMHRLLSHSSQTVRYFPPTKRTVTIQMIIIYTYSTFISLWVLFSESSSSPSWGLHEVDALYGFVCLPFQYSIAANLFWYLLFIPVFAGIPLLYIVWVVVDIYRKRLLPPHGKRRELTIYFFRITFVFIGFWIPTVFAYYIFRGLHPWGMFAFGVYTHSSGGVSAILSTFKPDVGKAVWEFVTCRSLCCRTIFCYNDDDVDINDRTNRSSHRRDNNDTYTSYDGGNEHNATDYDQGVLDSCCRLRGNISSSSGGGVGGINSSTRSSSFFKRIGLIVGNNSSHSSSIGGSMRDEINFPSSSSSAATTTTTSTTMTPTTSTDKQKQGQKAPSSGRQRNVSDSGRCLQTLEEGKEDGHAEESGETDDDDHHQKKKTKKECDIMKDIELGVDEEEDRVRYDDIGDENDNDTSISNQPCHNDNERIRQGVEEEKDVLYDKTVAQSSSSNNNNDDDSIHRNENKSIITDEDNNIISHTENDNATNESHDHDIGNDNNEIEDDGHRVGSVRTLSSSSSTTATTTTTGSGNSGKYVRIDSSGQIHDDIGTTAADSDA